MSGSDSNKDSITEVAEESFVRERPLEIERGAVLAGRYQVEEVIGKGGSGVVLRVFDRTVQNVVALKVLKSELARDSKWDKRFSRELRLGRPIQHPNVCRIFDIGEADGHRFLTMELATGGSLRDELKRRPALERPIEDRLKDARAAIEGLAAIHSAGVVHRDFKPDNLLRMEDGRLVISDFGLATDAAGVPGVTVMIGTPHYMAPEVLAGEPATARSDVWALGVVLHEIFFGRRPERKSVSFDGSEARPIQLTGRIERVFLQLCESCLADAPGERPANARIVLDKLEFSLLRDSPRRVVRKWLALLTIAVLAIGGLAVATRTLRRRRAQFAPAGSVLEPSGAGLDLAPASRLLVELPGHVHCFSRIDARTARVVWGSPRKAEDVDLQTGRRRPANLLAETYEMGCPEARGNSVLFTGRSPLGVAEIRLSRSSSGEHAAVLTSGSEPLWLKGEDSFVFTIDWDHAAVFSIPTMSFELLLDPLEAGYGIKDKAVSVAGDEIAIDYTNLARDAIVIYDGLLFERRKISFLSRPFHVAFGPYGDRLLVLGFDGSPEMSLGELDWNTGRFTRVGRIPDFDLAAVTVSNDGLGLVAERSARDVWRIAPGGLTQLTFDGTAYSAASSADGSLLLVSRRGDDARVNIWRYQSGVALAKLTEGTEDVAPAIAPDADTWAYADYVSRTIRICSLQSRACHALYSSTLVPTSPSFSSDGRMLVFMTQLKTTRFTVVSAKDGRVLSTWEGSDKCPPAWSPKGSIWTLEGGVGHYTWGQHDPATGVRLNSAAETAWSDQQGCGGPESGSTSTFVQIQIKSVTSARLLRVPHVFPALRP